MRERGAGHIVNVSSVGVRVPPGPRWGAYQASKGAFDMWLRSVAAELHADGIDVTSIYMALIHTRMTAPTASLRNVPGLSPDQAADIIAKAIIERPRTIAPWWLWPAKSPRCSCGRPSSARRNCGTGGASDIPTWSDGGRMTDGLVATGCRALLRSRLLIPPGPPALLRLGREVARGVQNLATLLGMGAARWPNRAALIDDEGAISSANCVREPKHSPTSCTAAASDRGHAVGVLCRNGRGFVQAVFAAALVGADVVLLNTDFRTESLAAALSSHRIGLVICDDEFAARARDADEGVTVVDAAGVDARDGSRPKVAKAGRIVLLTSGTTGAPKGVPRQPKIRLALGIGASILDRTGLRTGSRISVPVPMFHGLGFGMLALTLGLGGTVLTGRRFDAEATVAQASKHRADALTVVPVMLARILDLNEDVRARNPLPSLRVVVSSGARLDPSLARRFSDAYGEIIYNGYGSSEVGIGALATPTDFGRTGDGGRPVVGCAVRVLGENGEPVGPDVTGRVFVGGDLTFEGYTSGVTKDIVDDMMDTGDMGYLDRAGRLFIVGREDDMIVSGGENVYPRAVENALAEHPDVADNAVIGVPDEDYGQRLVAFVVPQPDADIHKASVREFLKDKVFASSSLGTSRSWRRFPAIRPARSSERADALTRSGDSAGSRLGRRSLVAVCAVEVQFPRKSHSPPKVASRRQLAENATQGLARLGNCSIRVNCN